jgi:uncharacterized membrane protein
MFWVVLTLIGLALLDWRAARIALIAFSATGLPMWFGYKWRYAQARRSEKEEKREEYSNGKNWNIPKDWIDREKKA